MKGAAELAIRPDREQREGAARERLEDDDVTAKFDGKRAREVVTRGCAAEAALKG